jgi:hypothetical protein
MIGAYDFCGHYEWTFGWLEKEGGHTLVREYWEEAIAKDSQQHASATIIAGGFEGMKKYWHHTLDEEAAGYAMTAHEDVFRIDMHACPSKGFLMRNGLVQYRDYCDHCMGWIGPVMREAGFVVDHEHNHRGQCWWEMRRVEDKTPPSQPGELSGASDVRLRPGWHEDNFPHDIYERATDPDEKRVE